MEVHTDAPFIAQTGPDVKEKVKEKKDYLPALVFSHFEFEGFRTVMPAQAGIQGEQAAASGYSAWIPAFAGMT